MFRSIDMETVESAFLLVADAQRPSQSVIGCEDGRTLRPVVADEMASYSVGKSIKVTAIVESNKSCGFEAG